MLLKKKIKQYLAISMAFSMIFSSNAFATPIDLVNSTESVATDTLNKTEGTDYFADEDTNVWANGEILEETRVSVSLDSEFIITIPKDIVLNGETGEANYTVNAKGDIAGNQILKVVPDAEFNMNENGGKSTTATVTQEKTNYTYQEMLGNGTDYSGSVKAILTAGEWAGKFTFNINFEDTSHIHNYIATILKAPTTSTTGEALYTCECNKSYQSELPKKGLKLSNYSWTEIARISEAKLADEYFNVGDHTTLEIYNETCDLVIMGFDHDELSNGVGTAGITFHCYDVITTAQMNSTSSNEGGWEKSEMRKYLNTTILNAFPAELQGVIKEVNKISDAGNRNKTFVTTTDKLFLLSCEEIGDGDPRNATYDTILEDQGKMYDFAKTDAWWETRFYMHVTTKVEWWLRSTDLSDTTEFHTIIKESSTNARSASDRYGIAPCFCI